MSKADKKKAAAARARALLGLDDTGPGPGSDSAREDVPERSGARGGVHVGRPAADTSRPDNRVEARDAKGKASSKRSEQVLDETNARVAVPQPEPEAARTAHVAQPIDPKHFPKKHAPGSLKRGDSVWYRGERFWVEFCPSSWDKGCYARITEHRIHPDPNVRSGTELAYVNEKGEGRGAPWPSFCVHPDLLSLAPTVGSSYAAQPTLAGVERRERAAKGERDVGDEVAVLLRGAKSLDDVYKIGAEYLSVQESELRNRYGHLNAGQQRMNIGNRMRAKWRKDRK